jgi:hypothetical protein
MDECYPRIFNSPTINYSLILNKNTGTGATIGALVLSLVCLAAATTSQVFAYPHIVRGANGGIGQPGQAGGVGAPGGICINNPSCNANGQPANGQNGQSANGQNAGYP